MSMYIVNGIIFKTAFQNSLAGNYLVTWKDHNNTLLRFFFSNRVKGYPAEFGRWAT